MAKELRRIYYISDDVMIQFVKIKKKYFDEDATDFLAFDSDFDNTFRTNFQQLITRAEKVLPHSTILSQRTQLTTTVEDTMARCRAKFKHIKYFIEKAFPGNRPVWNEFGYNKYANARKSQVKMIQFMEILNATALKYKAQLVAAKYAESQFGELESLRIEVNTADLQQELQIGDSPVLTQERVTLLNNVWETTKRVCRAGKIIFAGNPKKYERYLLPASEYKEEEATKGKPLTEIPESISSDELQ